VSEADAVSLHVHVQKNLERVKERIEAACRRSGRRRADVRLMGVTKFHPAAAVEAAIDAGLTLFGESRVGEGVEKFTAIRAARPGVEVHLIGALQRNKARTAAAFFDCVQSVDRDALVDELARQRGDGAAPLGVLLELRTGEASKSGYPDVDALLHGAERALACPGLDPRGLMTIAPLTSDETAIRAAFRALGRARDALEARFPGHWACLSMGMSGDFEIAIEEGSTLIRLGTALFGERLP